MVGIQQPSELALIQPTYEFVAHECRDKFRSIIAKLESAIEQGTSFEDTGERHSLARKMVSFGNKMQSGFGYPHADIPGYLKALDDLVIPDDMVEIKVFVVVLHKEVLGERTKPADYEGLLGEKDLKMERIS